MVRRLLEFVVLVSDLIFLAFTVENETVAVSVGSQRLVREDSRRNAPAESQADSAGPSYDDERIRLELEREEMSSLLEARRMRLRTDFQGTLWRKGSKSAKSHGKATDFDTTLNEKEGHEKDSECPTKPKQQFEWMFNQAGDRPNSTPGKLADYMVGIARVAKHSPHADRISLKLSTLVLDAWLFFIKEGKRDLKRFKQTMAHYRDDIKMNDDGGKWNKGFFIHLESCWKVATHMNPPDSLKPGEIRMHEFAYAFILAFGYTGKITSGSDFSNSDYLDLVRWKEGSYPLFPSDERFRPREGETGYLFESDLMDKWREAIAKDREVVPWVHASEDAVEKRIDVEKNKFGMEFPRINEPRFVEHFLWQNMDMFSNLNDVRYDNVRDTYFVNRWDMDWSQMTKRDSKNEALDREQHKMYLARAGFTQQEQIEELEQYREFLHHLFHAGVNMLPSRNVDPGRRRRRDNLQVADPAFQMISIVAHEFCFKGIRDGYGRDILMLVPTVQPEIYLTDHEKSTRGDKPIPPHLLIDQPKPRVDEDLDVKNGVEAPSPQPPRRVDEEELDRREAEAVEDDVNRELEAHFAALVRQHGSKEAASAASKKGEGHEEYLKPETDEDRKSRLQDRDHVPQESQLDSVPRLKDSEPEERQQAPHHHEKSTPDFREGEHTRLSPEFDPIRPVEQHPVRPVERRPVETLQTVEERRRLAEAHRIDLPEKLEAHDLRWDNWVLPHGGER